MLGPTMSFNFTVSPRVFKALLNVDISELTNCTAQEIRPVLPCLVRMSLISSLENTRECVEGRKEILTLLSGIEHVNSIVALLSIDFHILETDVKKEQQLRQKMGAVASDSILIQSLQNGLALEFERSDSTRRLRLVLSEILAIGSQVREEQKTGVKASELFDNTVYVPEICDVLCIAMAELPGVISITDVAETLLHVRHGPEIICWVVANTPDCFREVCVGLIANGDRQEDDSAASRMRMQAVSMLCQMNPSQALPIRAKCVEMCRMPALAITLSLEHAGRTLAGDSEGDMVAFVSGLLLGNDQQVRNWFAMFVRNSQKRKYDLHAALQLCRSELLRRLQALVLFSEDSRLPGGCVVEASALLRLYCALRGIASIKFQEDEVGLIVQLLTSHPPPSPAGVRFVSIGLCMLIACPSLIGQQEHEKRSVEWVQWLVREEAYFESASGVAASFGEMLLLMAIHFHSNQLSTICELVCSTLGMKVPIRHNNMTRMKQIFTQEIFTEQVVTSHAVKVPVTASLNANITGFLPVHCIHQLLKSRAFTKHKVPIKEWIYSQICSSVAPLHPVLPPLVEVYVNSMLVPSSKVPQEHTNTPITEEEVRAVFGTSLDCGPGARGPSLTCQLLLLYYLLLYEDVRLANTQNILSSGRSVKIYSAEFLSEIPIKYLLQQAHKDQQSYAGLFSPLLRLLATNFPHLSLVCDWLDDNILQDQCERHMMFQLTKKQLSFQITDSVIDEAFRNVHTCPSRTSMILQQLIASPPKEVWQFAGTIVSHFKSLLDDKMPRIIQELCKKVWLALNSVLPRKLWVLTTNALLHEGGSAAVTQESIVLDPLQVLRCDFRVFRCAPVLEVVLRVLEAALAASRNQLAKLALERPAPAAGEAEREELRATLVAVQESAALQILLEACLETDDDKEKPWLKWALREVRSVVCSFLHHCFIAEPSLAKLVHFQGYPRELLPVTVEGVPSMHICLDFIPELLSQPQLDKQVFAVDLASHLALRYIVPKSLCVARLAVNTLSTLLQVLPCSSRALLFEPVLPSLARICRAFPPLVDDTVSLLMQLGRVCEAQRSLAGPRGDPDEELCVRVRETFSAIVRQAVLREKVY
ncbi:integrator complex subunit 2 [Bacillus rossius redtenbacheri]|uniref:integrator complex subunit 2 n=1 Tax=Bacillus rossius redtenbacheri TaxID=93214 RepID=UPI002FDE11F3